MVYFSQLPSIVNGELKSLHSDKPVLHLITDSRKSVYEGSVFFAIKGPHHDGHDFISPLYAKGVRQFVVEYLPSPSVMLPDCNVIKVSSSLEALQSLAKFHRSQLTLAVIGITGSNGKTIIKEWLYLLLSQDYKIAKNPGSYNSQLGVPLSVWNLQGHHQLGIFEAGISRPGEMAKLANIIKPTIGIFSNLGPAHDEGFRSRQEKLSEKLKLFSGSKVIIYCRHHEDIHNAIQNGQVPGLSWGYDHGCDIKVQRDGSFFNIQYHHKQISVSLPFTDSASVENTLHCISLMLHLGYNEQTIRERITLLRSVPMRLELKEGINQCQLIDDTYNNDLAGLQISLDFLSNQRQKKKKSIILSDILESGIDDQSLAGSIAEVVSANNIHRFIGIGEVLTANKTFFPQGSRFHKTTEEFLNDFDWNEFQQEIILIKGARIFRFEKIVNKLQRKVHGTVMEIDLGAVVDNLNYFKSRLNPSTKIMVMVKAFAYGSGSIEIANVLQYHRVDYLGVAYADEGIELRKNNITLPIMVMNPSEETFQTILDHRLEPEIYSFKILKQYLAFLVGRDATVHLKLDTGMHRLGFESKDLEALASILVANSHLKVASIFSHLAGADEPVHDTFSKTQADSFRSMSAFLSQRLGYMPILHLLNSPGILRLPELQFDMVRLGIGLYGIDPTRENFGGLKPVATLKTIISQIKHIKAGETIGYGRRGKAEKDLEVATIAIGYADGFSRAFSRGVGQVTLNGKSAKVIGNVCMDMTMIDITGITAQEGDEVIIFGRENPIHLLAERIKTIPYEILTSTSERVKRVFVAESI
jgi:Alr-MurF fusion protein